MRAVRTVLSVMLALFVVSSAMMTAHAIAPEEQLSDPVLEERARDLSAQLRCLVCQNQSIDDSDAELAVDLRREVRVQLSDGLADDAILQNLQATYGDYILLNPPVSRATYLLWATPFLLVILAAGLFWQFRRTSAVSLPDEAKDEVSEDTNDEALSRPLIGGVVAAIIAVTGLLYWQIGRPDIAAQPISERAIERQQAQLQEANLTASLQEALATAKQDAQNRPSSVEAYLSLALAHARLDEFPQEVSALRRALSLSEEAPIIKAMLAEALSRQADGQITLPARALIEEVLAVLPTEPRALFMAGLAAYQDEAYGQAISYWRQLAVSAPSGTPWPDLARRNIITAAEEGGLALPAEFADVPDSAIPDAETVEAIASASDEDRAEMIAAMVEGLEARLSEAPDDREGWQRLIQARRVLVDEEGLLRALIGAAKALPDDREAQLDLLEYGLSIEAPALWLAQATDALARLARFEDATLEYLFFAGHVARLQGDKAQAIAHFEALYQQIPDDVSGFKAQLAAIITQLKDGS